MSAELSLSWSYLAVLAGVILRTVAVIARAVLLDHTDSGVATELPPALCPVTVTNVGPLPPLTHPERVGGLVDVKRPGEWRALSTVVHINLTES